MIYILSGQDDFSIAQTLERIKDNAGDRETLEINTTVLDGQQVTLEQFTTACETMPFLAEKRLVIVRGLFSRFEQKAKGGRRKKESKKDSDNGSEPFAGCISGMPESTVLVLIEETVSSANPLYKAIAGKATVKEFPLLKDSKLREWVQKRVMEEDGDITPRAADLLARLVGSNLWTMSGEVNKLVLYTGGRKIEEEDVRTLVGYTEQYSVFNMVDAILEFRAEQAEQILQQQLQAGAAPVYLLTMLARQVRLIVLSKDLSSRKVPRTEMMKRLGVTNDFVVRKTQEQANRYLMDRLREVYHKILECDVSIKTGKLGDELALNILVAELSRRPAGAAATRRSAG